MMPKTSPNSSLKPGPTTPLGSVLPDVADLLADVVPAVRHVARRRVAAQIDEDRRDSGAGVAGQVVEAWYLLEPALDPLGDLGDRVLEGGPGPRRLHDHRPEGEGRVLVAAEADEGERAGDHGSDHEVDDERAALDRPLREIGPDHDVAPSRRTFWPGRSAWTPAVTTMSPGARPCRDDDPRRIVAQHLDVAQRHRLRLPGRPPRPPAAGPPW